MTRKMPPVPPANVSDKGPRQDEHAAERSAEDAEAQARQRGHTPKNEGQADNIEQNTHNQGYQQDR